MRLHVLHSKQPELPDITAIDRAAAFTAAAQPAALEEDDGAYAGAVVDGVLLDVEDEAFGLLVVESAHAFSLIA